MKCYAYAWAIKGSRKWLLCKWSEPTKERLLAGKKPSPEAKIVRVKMETTNAKDK